METSSHVKEIRQCNCMMCRATREHSKSFSKWGTIRTKYRSMFSEIIKGADPDKYNKHLVTRDYDA